MDSFVLMLIATSAFIGIKADNEPQIDIYEIRKARDDSDRLDFQYYDPDDDSRPENRQYDLTRNRAYDKNRDIDTDIVTNNLIDKLKRIVNSNYDSNRKDDDYILSYRDLKNENIFDNNKTPVVIIADDRILYHLIPHKSSKLQNKLQSVLRSINNENEVEDRTAPPRTRIVYEYDDYD